MAFLFYFEFMNMVTLNGKIIDGGKPVLIASNRGFRYGDALFETMKIINGKILLENYHFERLFNGLRLMKFENHPGVNRKALIDHIAQLLKENKCENLARVRLTVFRDNGSLYDESKNIQYLIECWPLKESINKLNGTGLVIDIFPDARKSCDKFSNLKSANYLPYVMAAIYAKENELDDCLVMNTYEHICDATIANVFWTKDQKVYTPSLSEGCIAGVMRSYLIKKLKESTHDIQETPCTIETLESADEIFLTNALNGIRWVKQFRSKQYSNKYLMSIYQDLILPLFAG